MAATIQDAVMLFGDSITQGAWELNGIGARLAHVYARKFDVLNRGYSGYNTRWAIPVFEQIFAKQNEQRHVPPVRLLTIWFGANDSVLETVFQHVPLPEFKSNLKRLISMVQSQESAYYSPSTRILLITPPPVNTYQRNADLASRSPPRQPDRLFEVTKAYAEAVREVGLQVDVPVVDVYTKIWVAAGKDEKSLNTFLRDGLHLNETGYGLAYDELITTIREKLPDLDPEMLRYVIPRHDELDPENYQQTVKARSVERLSN